MAHHKDGMDVNNDWQNVCKSIAQAQPDQIVRMTDAMVKARAEEFAPTDQIERAAEIYIKETGDPTQLMGHFVERLNKTLQRWNSEMIEMLQRDKS